MADNTQLNLGAGGDLARTVDKSGKKAGVVVMDIGGSSSEVLLTSGQQLAVGSIPVVLTAAQVTTLTPPAAISGFATAVKQPALGTAGTASADVLSVQGIASMTALKVDGSASTQPSAPTASTSGGATAYRLLSAATTNATSLKGSAGQLFSVQFCNRSTTANAYVKFYNKATSPTVGTDTPIKTFCVPAAASSILPSSVIFGFPMPVAFGTGIGFAITGGTGLDADTTAVAANDVTVNIDYK